MKTRFAPTPSGCLHIGSIRIIILNYLFAKKHKGEFILRIDDTDKERCKKEYEEAILNDMKWLGINYEKLLRQSDRISIYDQYFNMLVQKGAFYECFENEEDLEQIKRIKMLRKEAPMFTKRDKIKTEGKPYWRFDIGKEEGTIHDIIIGTNYWKRTWSDPVVRRSDGTYTYIFVSIVDDILENITHVIRGVEHFPNAIIQQEMALKIKEDFQIEWAHFPLFTNLEGNKLSKRNKDTSLKDLQYLEPATFFSLLSNIGNKQKQIFSANIDDYINSFSLDDFTPSQAKISSEMFLNTNRKILPLLSEKILLERGVVLSLWNMVKNNIEKFEDYYKWEQIFNKVDIKKIPYWEELKNHTILEVVKKHNLDKVSFYKSLTKSITDESNTPPIQDIINYLINRHIIIK
jgi:glutamyl-tRNA synthetase